MSDLLKNIESKRKELEVLIVHHEYDLSNYEVINKSQELDELLNCLNYSNPVIVDYRHLKRDISYLVRDSVGIRHSFIFKSYYPCDDWHGENAISFTSTKDDRIIEWHHNEFTEAVEIAYE